MGILSLNFKPFTTSGRQRLGLLACRFRAKPPLNKPGALTCWQYLASAEPTGKRRVSNCSVRATHRSYAFSHAAPDALFWYDLICQSIRDCFGRVIDGFLVYM